jgi:hypothetical protein
MCWGLPIIVIYTHVELKLTAHVDASAGTFSSYRFICVSGTRYIDGTSVLNVRFYRPVHRCWRCDFISRFSKCVYGSRSYRRYISVERAILSTVHRCWTSDFIGRFSKCVQCDEYSNLKTKSNEARGRCTFTTNVNSMNTSPPAPIQCWRCTCTLNVHSPCATFTTVHRCVQHWKGWEGMLNMMNRRSSLHFGRDGCNDNHDNRIYKKREYSIL